MTLTPSNQELAAFDALVEALAFYADPDSYFAVFIQPDRPAGAFADDFSEDHGHPDYDRAMPGERARSALRHYGPTLLNLLAAVWDHGCAAGTSRAMRHMSDEPNLPLAGPKDNPYRIDQASED